MSGWRSTNWDFVVIGCAVTTVVVSAVHADVIQVPADHLTIQSAIDAATDGDEIVLAMGIYPEQIDFTGKAITVRSVDPTLPEVVATTVIDAGGKGTAVALRTGEGPSTVLDGITITGGFGDSGGAGVNGGGLHVMGSAATVSRCVFTGNASGYGGGALLIEESTPVFIDCTFYANSAVTRGGAAYIRFLSCPSFIDCLFLENTCELVGGAMFSSTSDVVISGCTFRGNTAGGAGGAIESTSFSFPNIVATLFVDNTVTDGPGGAIHNAGNTAATISGCTFSANTATVGGGMSNEAGGEPQIAESTFCGNAPDAIAGAYTDGGRNVFADRCPCPADTNGDGTVDVIDLVAVILDWGNDGTARGADVVPDGVVDVLDLVAVVVAWGECD